MKAYRKAYSFDDMLLVPGYSEVLPSQVDLSTRLTKKITLKLPFLSAPMDTVTEKTMAIALAEEGALGVIHKNMPIEDQARQVAEVKSRKLLVGASVGVNDDKRVDALLEAKCDLIVVDSAHGHSRNVLQAVKRAKGVGAQVCGGNVVTKEGARALVKAGADCVKIGVGPGSICTTRIVTGVGFPQLSAVFETVGCGVPVIADGGVKYAGDAAKALAAGASAIMAGGLFSGTDEAPGELMLMDGKKFKSYRGMGSIAAMKRGSSSRYNQEDLDEGKLVAQGVEGLVEYKGPVKRVLMQLAGGVRSGMGFVGAKNLKELRKKAEFVEITWAGVKESHPHSLKAFKSEENYRG
ncbi:MAG: IMP dehydrogenase [Candidatus Micrarchaeota archaeon]